MSKLSKSILSEIKKSHVKPRPKWQFVVWRVLFWMLFIVSVFLGSMAIGVIIQEILGMEWSFVGYLGGNRALGFLMVLPYIWLIVLGLTVFFAQKAFAKTNKGYRHKPIAVVGLVLVLSLVLGGVAHQLRVSHGFEDIVQASIGPYADWQQFRGGLWVNPDEGLLAGTISEVNSDTVFIIDAINEEVWTVDISNGTCKKHCDPQVGMATFVLGSTTDELHFEATQFKLMDEDDKPPFFERKKGKGMY